jgi:glycosyltransferase involved in cell wall biosynthesis
MISAEAFEHGFTVSLTPAVDLRVGDIRAFLDGLVTAPQPYGPAQRQEFLSRTAGVHALSVDYQALVALPFLARLRNLSGSLVRLLVVAHTPAVCPFEWALLLPLLRPGDRVIAPTHSARQALETLCPDLLPFVRVIPHPILLPSVESRAGDQGVPRLVFLGRPVAGKLLHRLLDAHDELARAGTRVHLDIAGPLTAPRQKGETRYVRSLRARAERLRLDGVNFHGLVRREAKCDLLRRARMLVNPSVSLEESFGKSIAEGLAHGVPSVVSRWDGLPEVAAPVGREVAVRERIFAMDIEPHAIADALEAMLDAPPDREACTAAARRFSPDRVGARYRAILEEAICEGDNFGTDPYDIQEGCPAAPAKGLLSVTAPLPAYTFEALHAVSLEEARRWHRNNRSDELSARGQAEQLRERLIYGTRRPLERLFAGIVDASHAMADASQSERDPMTAPAGNPAFLDRVATAALDPACSRTSRVVCLDLLRTEGRYGAVRRGMAELPSQEGASPGICYLQTEMHLSSGDPELALENALQPTEPGWWDEHAAHRLTQLARAAVAVGGDGRVLQRLRDWTTRYPDGPDAAEVWMALGMCAGVAGRRSEARACMARARRLLGPQVHLEAAEACIDAELEDVDEAG